MFLAIYQGLFKALFLRKLFEIGTLFGGIVTHKSYSTKNDNKINI